jgi:hypothetical protein
MAAPNAWRGALLAAAALGAIAFVALRLAAPSLEPAPVAWDRVACAHCRMLVSDPRFAAQLALEDGEVLHFDDPGCLLLWRAGSERRALAAWFHDSASERWLAESEAAFASGAETPMGYGFAAIARGSATGALDAAAVLAALEARR